MKRLIQLLLPLFCAACLCLLFLTPAFGEAQADGAVTDVNTTPKDRVTRFLLLGCDRASGLTDSILLVTVNETEKKASVLQIPRDTYAEYTERDYKKLNGGMSALGESGIKGFLSEALGVPIDYFAVIKLDCFDDIVDAVGGVDVEILQDMHYTDPVQDLEIALHAGKAHLDGKQAEQFVRYRSGYANADLGRLDAQKLFLRAFAQKCKSLSASQFFRVVCASLTGVQTDMGITDAIRVAGVLRQCDADTFPMMTLPGQAIPGKSGAWYYVLNREGACRMINEYAAPLVPLEVEEFDPYGVFDREKYTDFHNIYIAEEKSLPLV